MKIFLLKREVIIPVSISEAWLFFSDPRNLKTITPPKMDFKILTKNLPQKIYSGLMIDYAVRPLAGIKTKWVTEIKEVNEPYVFIDEQHKGPYSFWRHSHTFKEAAKGTSMTDEVQYALPFSVLGIVAHHLFVKNKLNIIFNYREKIIREIFNIPNI
jgi:ligand-binding SRPBCC domain-containing protein